jgi:hypothetical protein
MKAIVQERFGPPDVLQLVDTDPPEVGADDVLVRVHAAALNPYDWHIMRGDPLIRASTKRRVAGQAPATFRRRVTGRNRAAELTGAATMPASSKAASTPPPGRSGSGHRYPRFGTIEPASRPRKRAVPPCRRDVTASWWRVGRPIR